MTLKPVLVVGFAAVSGYVASLFTVWTSTLSAVGLFGRPTSDVEVERFGVDYTIQGIGGAGLLLACLVGRAAGLPRRPAVGGAVVVALGAIGRAVTGDSADTVVGPVDLVAAPGLVLAVFCAVGVALSILWAAPSDRLRVLRRQQRSPGN